MYLVLVVVGAVLAAAGVAMMRSGMPLEDMSSVALFVSGIVALVGALVIGALAVVARTLGRIAERMEIQPLPLPPVVAVGREDPAPRAARSPAPAAAMGAARPSLLGWLGRGSAPTPARAAQPPPAIPAAEPAPASVDLAPLTRIVEPSVATPPPPATPAAMSAPKPAVSQNGAASTVYRSGVIDGMAYTLFMDGSIQAELPQGTVKFGHIDDLQKYLLGNR
ncbi:MAG: hypothetical protein WDO17_10985 [Alphaproteobacteria bacterium]